MSVFLCLPTHGSSFLRSRFLFLITIILTLLALQAVMPMVPSARGGEAPAPGLSDGAWPIMQAQISEAQYDFTWHELGQGFSAFNPDHGWQTTFSLKGAAVTSAAANDDSWQWALRLRSYGYEGNMTEMHPVIPAAEKNRVEYAWDGNLSEWWINDVQGLEQGFTIRRRPSAASTSVPLLINLSLDTDLQPLQESDNILFRNSNGEIVLRYAKLSVLDAEGHKLPAAMRLKDGIQLRIDDTAAAYPLVIDPLLISEVKKLTASDGAGDDEFGKSVAVSGDTLVVGAWYKELGTGAAYVFRRNEGSADNWGEVKKLTASDGVKGDGFGYSVAISDGIIVVGAFRKEDTGHHGAAYIFARNKGGADNWGEVKKLEASDGLSTSFFGSSVAVDGDAIVIGAHNTVVNQGAAFVFVRNEGGADNWGEVKKLTASDGAANNYFGGAVTINGNTVLIGARSADGFKGKAYVFARNEGGADNWGEVKKLTASDNAAYDGFGRSVAISDETLLVGAKGGAYLFARNFGGADNWGELKKLTSSDIWAGSIGSTVALSENIAFVGNSGTGSQQGAIYTFRRNLGGPDAWGEFTKLAPSMGTPGDSFGSDIDLSGDTLVVGAQLDNNFQGAAYVFRLDGSCWEEQQKAVASDGAADDEFGLSVAIDAGTLVVGANHNDDYKGAAYVFSHKEEGVGAWGEVRKLVASDGSSGDIFGHAVALSGDVIVVGAPFEDSDRGAAYVFERNEGGADNWGEVKKLVASNGAEDDVFGWSLDISAETIVVGAIGKDGQQGAAYVFERNEGGADNWGQVTILAAGDGAARDSFGSSVSITEENVLVGASGDENYRGAAYLFARNEGDPDNWGQLGKLIAADGSAGDFFGSSVDLDADIVAVGAFGYDNDKGAAYVFTRNEGGADNWGQVVKLTASDGVDDDEFGGSVAISGAVLIAGAREQEMSRGAAYVFARNEGGADNWGEVRKLTASDASEFGYFGASVDVSGDNLAIGAFRNESRKGAAYIFQQVACADEIDTCPEVPGNVIQNYCFEDGPAPWQFFTNGEGSYVSSSIDPYQGQFAAQADIIRQGSNVQFFQKGISLKPGTEYELSFAANSSNANELSVYLHKHTFPYTNYGLSDFKVDLQTGWNLYQTRFTTRGFNESVNDARLRFWFAPYDVDYMIYRIDWVVLREVDEANPPIPPQPPAIVPPPGQCNPDPNSLIANGGFESGKDGWAFWTDGAGSFSTTDTDPYECANNGLVSIRKSGSTTQLYQKEITLQGGETYRLRLAARSNNGRDVKLFMHKHDAPYTNYGLSGVLLDLTVDWQVFVVDFTAVGSEPLNDARLRLWLAPFDAPGTIFEFDDLVLLPLDDSVGSTAVPTTLSETTLAAAVARDLKTAGGVPADSVQVQGYFIDGDELGRLAGGYVPENGAPSCYVARPSLSTLLPNGKMARVKILGLGSPQNVTITGITQDELVDPLPDARFNGATAWLRRERDAQGDGRVYTIAFDAAYKKGPVCSYEVRVAVPLNRKIEAVDSGAGFDSTQ
jgi:hypothetical protein